MYIFSSKIRRNVLILVTQLYENIIIVIDLQLNAMSYKTALVYQIELSSAHTKYPKQPHFADPNNQFLAELRCLACVYPAMGP